MGRDEGVQRVLRSLVGSTHTHGFAATVWSRSRRFFAEARVFQRRPAGPVEVIRLETDEEDAALALLEGKIEETYGPVKFVRWWKVGDDAPSAY